MLGHFRVRAFDDVASPAYRAFAATGYGLNYRMHPLAAALARRQFQDLDAYIDGRTANLERLSARLAPIPGIEPPSRKAYVTRHRYYNYKPQYQADELEGLDRRVYIEALRAEGAPVDASTSMPLHCEGLFQVRDDGSRTYGREENRRVYARETCRTRNTMLSGPCASRATPARAAFMDQIADAFEKVYEPRNQLLDAPAARPRTTASRAGMAASWRSTRKRGPWSGPAVPGDGLVDAQARRRRAPGTVVGDGAGRHHAHRVDVEDGPASHAGLARLGRIAWCGSPAARYSSRLRRSGRTAPDAARHRFAGRGSRLGIVPG